MPHYHVTASWRRLLQTFIYTNDSKVWDEEHGVLNLHCKGISSCVVLPWLGFSSSLSHCHLVNVEQTLLPSYLWKKGNNFMLLTMQGKP